MNNVGISFKSYKSTSERASSAARGASRKYDTKPELHLRKALWQSGLRYRINVKDFLGKPDIVFRKKRIVIFCDGDFWHGKNWKTRRKKILQGSNSDYWINKIERNIERDKLITHKLRKAGWIVLRFWESDIYNNTDQIVAIINDVIQSR